ncbi:MAG: hypothetical protein R3A52_23055 [Polyangiales bacterium]
MARTLFSVTLALALASGCERTPGTSREVSPPSTLAPDPGRTQRPGLPSVSTDVPDAGDMTLDDPDEVDGGAHRALPGAHR